MRGLLPTTLKLSVFFYLVLLVSVSGLTGCQPQETETMQNRPPLTLRYQTSAEVMYTDIRVENGRLMYTFFNDPDNRCAQWFKSTPCWTEDDLQTRERELTEPELAALYALVAQLQAEPLKGDSFGETNLRKRAYTETLTINYDQTQQQLRYRSSPQAEPKPALFAELESKLRGYAAGLAAKAQ